MRILSPAEALERLQAYRQASGNCPTCGDHLSWTQTECPKKACQKAAKRKDERTSTFIQEAARDLRRDALGEWGDD